jgi:Guanylate-binding protein, C-terminal domain
MKTLRGRIFKRVKPKSLNGTNITGDSLLSLAEAYVDSINHGSVPCIESAWTSVCKNECAKASADSLASLKQNLAILVKGNNGSPVLSSDEF